MTDKSALAGKVALVTGAANGLGRAMAKALAGAGAEVAGLDLSADRLAHLESELKDRLGGGRFLPIVGDVAERNVCEAAVEQVVATFGTVDILVNNAGVGTDFVKPAGTDALPRFWTIDPGLWFRVMMINGCGPYFMAHAAVPYMLNKGWGRIVNVTTSFRTMLSAGRSAYGAAKAALEASTLVWSQDLAGTGVTANVLIPGGPTSTGIFTAGAPDLPLFEPEIMAPPILWLASGASDEVTGCRFIACDWDPALPPDEAAARIRKPAAWPNLAV